MKISYRQIQLMCVLYLVTWMLAPPLSYDTIYRLMAIGVAGIWMFIQISLRKKDVNLKVHRQLKIYLICVFIYAIVLFAFRCIFNHMTPWNAFYSDVTTYILLFIGYIGGVYCRDMRYAELKRIFYWALVIAVLFSITSIFRPEEYYELTRNAGGIIEEEKAVLAREAAMHGVGAFGFFCFTSVFAPLVLWFSYAQTGKRKVLIRIAFVIIEVGVFSAGYTLALLISLVGISICLVVKTRSMMGKIVVVFSTFLLLIFWNSLAPSLYSFLQNVLTGTLYENKVADIFSFLIEGESTGAFKNRQERYIYSLQSIFKYPILGSYVFAGIRAVGAHSSILDTFAAYGWLVGSAWIYIIIIFPHKLSCSAQKGYKLLGSILLFLTALFNQYVMMMGVFYFLFPAVAYWSTKK